MGPFLKFSDIVFGDLSPFRRPIQFPVTSLRVIHRAAPCLMIRSHFYHHNASICSAFLHFTYKHLFSLHPTSNRSCLPIFSRCCSMRCHPPLQNLTPNLVPFLLWNHFVRAHQFIMVDTAPTSYRSSLKHCHR